MSRTVVTVLSLLCVFCRLSLADFNITNIRQPKPIDKGLKPLYVMTNTFLEVVHPDFRGSAFSDSRFDAAFSSRDVSSAVDAFQSAASDWHFWLRHYWGYTVWVVIGVAFIVLMPIIGLFLCICRCAGHCGGKRHYDNAPKYDRCRRATCGLLLLVFATLITAGMVCAFVTNQLLQDQTSGPLPPPSSSFSPLSSSVADGAESSAEVGLVGSVVDAFYVVDNYQQSIMQELKTGIIPRIRSAVSAVHSQLDEFPTKAHDRLSSATNSLKVLNAVIALADSLDEISDELRTVDNYTRILQSEQRELVRSLSASRRRALDLLQCDPLPPATRAECDKIRLEITSTNIAFNYSQFDNVTSQLTQVQHVIDNELKAKLEKVREDFSNISMEIFDKVKDHIMKHVAEAKKVVGDIGDELISNARDTVDRVVDGIQLVKINEAVNFVQTTLKDKVQTYGNYRYYVGIVLSCLLLLVVTFLYLGLCFGACGETAGHDARWCNRGIGACLLLTGVALVFLFSWILMIAVVLLFVSGGATYTEVCHPLLETSPSSSVIRVTDQILATYPGAKELSLSYISIMNHCESNAGLYTALNLDIVFNITGQTEQLTTELWTDLMSFVSKLNASFTDNVNLITPEIHALLNQLVHADIDRINFTSFEVLLKSDVLTVDLSSVIRRLSDFSSSLTDDNQRQQLNQEITQLRQIVNVDIPRIHNTAGSLLQVITGLERHVHPGSKDVGFANYTYDLIVALNNTQADLQVNGTRIIQQYVRGFAAELFNTSLVLIADLLDHIENKIGQCRLLYDAVHAVLSSVCETFLNPFNGFWFSVGWCLAFTIPAIIVSLHLATLYRSTVDFPDGKSFDQAAYENNSELSSSEDSNIQLVHHRRGRIHPVHRGHQNVDYEEGINPPPPANLYAMRSRDVNPAVARQQDFGLVHPTAPPPHYDFHYSRY